MRAPPRPPGYNADGDGVVLFLQNKRTFLFGAAGALLLSIVPRGAGGGAQNLNPSERDVRNAGRDRWRPRRNERFFCKHRTPGSPKKRTPGACQKGSRAFSSRFGEGRFFPGNKNSFSHPAPKRAFSPPTTRGAFLIQHRGRPFLLPRPHPFFVLSFQNLAKPRSQERNPRQPMRHGGRLGVPV